MLKILVVDDEYIVRYGIRETIDWEEHGFTIVGEASDGDEAYEKCLELHPDIIITDIRMGSMDGLELISHLTNNKIDVEIVILTGFEDFQYAKKAIEGGVNAYLLKPVRNEELLNIMLSLKSKIENKHQVKTALQAYTSGLKNSFLLDLLGGKYTDFPQIQEQCASCSITLPGDNYMIASIQIDNSNSLSYDLDKLHVILRDIIDYSIATHEFYLVTCVVNVTNIVMFIFHRIPHQIPAVTDLLNNIRNQFLKGSGQTLTIGTSGIFRNITAIHKAYNQSVKALELKALLGNNRIIDYTSIPDNTNNAVPVISTNKIETVIKSIKKLDKETVFQIIGEFFAAIPKTGGVDLNEVRSVVVEFVIMILRSVFENANEMKQVLGKVPQPSIEVQKFETVNDIEQWTHELLLKLFDRPEVLLRFSYKHEVQKAISIIMRDYAKSITIETVAEELFISPYHLMRTFKKETSKTFNEYLTEYRMEIATQMLKSGNYCIYEVSELVGYKNSQYFSQIFKKSTGYSPKSYTNSSED